MRCPRFGRACSNSRSTLGLHSPAPPSADVTRCSTRRWSPSSPYWSPILRLYTDTGPHVYLLLFLPSSSSLSLFLSVLPSRCIHTDAHIGDSVIPRAVSKLETPRRVMREPRAQLSSSEVALCNFSLDSLPPRPYLPLLRVELAVFFLLPHRFVPLAAHCLCIHALRDCVIASLTDRAEGLR